MDKDNSQNEKVQKTIRVPGEILGNIAAITGHEMVKQRKNVSENDVISAFLSSGVKAWKKANPGKNLDPDKESLINPKQ